MTVFSEYSRKGAEKLAAILEMISEKAKEIRSIILERINGMENVDGEEFTFDIFGNWANLDLYIKDEYLNNKKADGEHTQTHYSYSDIVIKEGMGKEATEDCLLHELTHMVINFSFREKLEKMSRTQYLSFHETVAFYIENMDSNWEEDCEDYSTPYDLECISENLEFNFNFNIPSAYAIPKNWGDYIEVLDSALNFF